jgi:hypothetical protein
MATAKGTEQLNVGIDAALLEELRAFVKGRRERLRAVVEMALRRHMANPPAQELPPLPPVTAPASGQHATAPADAKATKAKKK